MPRAPPASEAARKTVRKAFDDLKSIITPQDWQASQNETLEGVRKAAVDIETQLAAKQSLRNMRRLKPLLAGMEHYAKVMDILCNGTPFLSWIWAPITLILRVASEWVEAFEKIMDGYSRIAASLARFGILNMAFSNNHGFQESLAAVYEDILQFHQHAYRFVRRSGWKLLFITSWGRFGRRFEHILNDLEKHGDLIDKEANALNIEESQKMRKELQNWKERSLESLKNEEKQLSDTQYRSISSWLNHDEFDQLAIFDSIASEVEKYPGTCSWFIQHPSVRTWLQRRATMPILWLKGIPGSGKSSICSQLVNFMTSGNFPVLQYFCSSSYTSSGTYERILRSLLLQLTCRNDDIIAHVYHKYVNVEGRVSPKISVLERMFRDLFEAFSQGPGKTEYIWILIDGLNECPIEKQERLVALLNQITSKFSSSEGTKCKALISCQSFSPISKRGRKENTIFLGDEKSNIHDSIRLYASHRLVPLLERFAQIGLSREQGEQIELAIAQKADGMFLYARLVLDYLAANIFYTSEELISSINQLPERLVDFYQRILNQIVAHLDPRSVTRVRCLFGWVAYQKRPLKRLELLSAVTFSTGASEIDNLAPEYILDVCGPLLSQKQDTTINFVHSSVKLFLCGLSSNMAITEDATLLEHGLATIACLLSGMKVFDLTFDPDVRQFRVLRGLHGLHLYATEHWTDYLLLQIDPMSDGDRYLPLFQLACELAQKLEDAGTDAPLGVTEENSEWHTKLSSLSHYPVLAKQVGRFLNSRSLKILENQCSPTKDFDELERHNTNKTSLDSISSMLEVYQETIRKLLVQHEFPGISADALKFFKSQFGTSAFTCRLKGCPRATIGFSSSRGLSEHQSSHLRLFACADVGCQNLPSMSFRALKQHEKKYHALASTPRIRRMPHLQQSQQTQYLQNQLPTQQVIQQRSLDIFPPMPAYQLNQPSQTLNPSIDSVTDQSELSPADQQKVRALGLRLFISCPMPQKNHYRQLVLSRFPDKSQEYTNSGKDPALIWFEIQAFRGVVSNATLKRRQQQAREQSQQAQAAQVPAPQQQHQQAQAQAQQHAANKNASGVTSKTEQKTEGTPSTTAEPAHTPASSMIEILLKLGAASTPASSSNHRNP